MEAILQNSFFIMVQVVKYLPTPLIWLIGTIFSFFEVHFFLSLFPFGLYYEGFGDILIPTRHLVKQVFSKSAGFSINLMALSFFICIYSAFYIVFR